MEIQTDFLVIGSGVAGLSFALKVADTSSVALITKREIIDANTTFAQGGVASVFDRMDSFDLHINDTLAAGAGLCRPDVVEMVVKNAPDRILELIHWGVRFNVKTGEKNGAGAPQLELGREGGHSRKRIVHAQDMTGREIERVLVELARSHPNIRIYEHHAAIDLITFTTLMKRGQVTTSHREHCCGAYALSTKEGRVKTFSAKATLLATGGTGKVYLYTSNPDIATGDGIAMAYRAGATVANLEFVQFHPTCLYHPDAKNFLISETVRGEGGVLLDAAGKRFMEKYDPMKDLACRDKVARAIDSEMKMSGADSVFLDISHRPAQFVAKRFPNLYASCLKYGFDMTKQPVPVVPAAHYMCGGVVTDKHGRTDIRGLFAVGETACTGAARGQPAGQQFPGRGAGVRPKRGPGRRRGPSAAETNPPALPLAVERRGHRRQRRKNHGEPQLG